MTYRKEVFQQQVPLVDRFVRHLLHHRAIKAANNTQWTRSWFWADTCDAHLLQATICWCMVFGSHGQNPTHLRRLAVGQSEELQKSFRVKLLTTLQISEPEWITYWNEMLAFRNKFAAHRELAFNAAVPILDRALEAALSYDDWVRGVIYPDVLGGPALRKSVSQWQEALAIEISRAIDASTAEQAVSPEA